MNEPLKEPSVLDYVKAKLMPWKYRIDDFDWGDDSNAAEGEYEWQTEPLAYAVSISEGSKGRPFDWPWYFLLAALLAVVGQIFMEPPGQSPILAIVFYGLSAALILFSMMKGDILFTRFQEGASKEVNTEVNNRKYLVLLLSFLSLILAFLAFTETRPGDIQFNNVNLFFWILSLILFLVALVDGEELRIPYQVAREYLRQRTIPIKITPWFFLIAAVTAVVFFFRFYQLDAVIGEMFSDHAEKLLDVYNVLSGEHSVFFPRNTGREFFQFYLTALVAIVLNTGVSFMSLKIGTALAGFVALPYIYKLGKELGGRWVGLIAFFLAGISYWHNVISRVGLRFPLYPLFAAPAMFYLIRGLRQKRRNDFIYAGIALGMGLHGYSSARFLPFVILAGVILFWLHSKNKGYRFNTVFGLTITILVSFMVFLPLFKYTLLYPEAVSYRALTRLGTTERAFAEPVYLIFLKNTWSALTMFFYSNGNTWVHSIPLRPALDIITAAFYFLGSLIVLLRYIRLRNWEDLFLLISVPLLMMPSILSLAFPEENPSLNRTGGAIIPVFIIAAIGFEGIFSRLIQSAKSQLPKIAFTLLPVLLLLASVNFNYDLVFNQFNRQFMQNAWNTSQIGRVIRGFADSVGDADHAFVVPSAHWVDTRLVGIVAGYPTRDFALWPEHFGETLDIEDQMLFILKPENTQALELLEALYPQHSLYRYDSGRPGKDFLIFSIPAQTAPVN